MKSLYHDSITTCHVKSTIRSMNTKQAVTVIHFFVIYRCKVQDLAILMSVVHVSSTYLVVASNTGKVSDKMIVRF